jgi:hypothetical protein
MCSSQLLLVTDHLLIQFMQIAFYAITEFLANPVGNGFQGLGPC